MIPYKSALLASVKTRKNSRCHPTSMTVTSVLDMRMFMNIIPGNLNTLIHKIFNRTNYRKHSTRNKIIDTWNKISLAIKHSGSIKNFNKKMKQFLLSHINCCVPKF